MSRYCSLDLRSLNVLPLYDPYSFSQPILKFCLHWRDQISHLHFQKLALVHKCFMGLPTLIRVPSNLLPYPYKSLVGFLPVFSCRELICLRFLSQMISNSEQACQLAYEEDGFPQVLHILNNITGPSKGIKNAKFCWTIFCAWKHILTIDYTCS